MGQSEATIFDASTLDLFNQYGVGVISENFIKVSSYIGIGDE